MGMNPTKTESGSRERRTIGRRRPEPGERERVVAEWVASGKKVEEMAVVTGWPACTLYRWRSDLREKKALKQACTTKLLPVPKPAFAMSGAWAAEVTVGSGLSVRLSAGCTPEWAAQLVGELKRC